MISSRKNLTASYHLINHNESHFTDTRFTQYLTQYHKNVLITVINVQSRFKESIYRTCTEYIDSDPPNYTHTRYSDVCMYGSSDQTAKLKPRSFSLSRPFEFFLSYFSLPGGLTARRTSKIYECIVFCVALRPEGELSMLH